MKPSVALEAKRLAVRELVRRHRTANPRVFGSASHGEDSDGSDLDLLVDPLPGTTLFDLGDLQAELEDILGVPVDLQTPGDLPLKFREFVLSQARPVEQAATKLANDDAQFVTQHPALPWKAMRGMRNRIAHGYFEINPDIVWDTVRMALPQLAAQLRAIRAQQDGNSASAI